LPDATEKPPEEAPSKALSRSLWWWLFALLGLGLAGGAAWFIYLNFKGENFQIAPMFKPASSTEYLSLEPVVINLGDEGGGRFAQVGITFQVRDSKSVEDLKKMLPNIRNRILISLSDRKAQDLLTKEGKERLAADILVETGRAFGMGSGSEKADNTAASPASNPVVQVLFSSLIIQ
jgi:flagellar FliL protein